MVRAAHYTAQSFITAAIELTAEKGPSAATTAAIAKRVGAPIGSVYHRFESRGEILAIAWAQCHQSFCDRVCDKMKSGHVLAAALETLEWSRSAPTFARFLFLNEVDFIFEGTDLPDDLRAQIQVQQDVLEEAFRECLSSVTKEFGNISDNLLARLKFFLFDGLISLIKPHLISQKLIPAYLEDIIRDMYNFVLAQGARELNN